MTVKKFDPTFYHKCQRDILEELQGDVSEVITFLQQAVDGKVNPSISIEVDRYDYDEYLTVTLTWYEPMTKEEVVAKKAELAKEAETKRAARARQRLVKEAKKAETPEAAVEILKADPQLLSKIIQNLR